MKKMTEQRLIGLALIVICIFIIAFANQGTNEKDQDGTAILFLLPLGIYAVVTKEYILYDPNEASAEEEIETRISELEKGTATWHENVS
jgi:drug/metabolite transporter (DMT)-like permease